jgi:glucose-6-phosphate isomerase
MAAVQPVTARASWKALEAHYRAINGVHMRKLFADDPARGTRLALEAAGLYLDYSKNRVTDETLGLLVKLAEESDLRGRIDAMFLGENALGERVGRILAGEDYLRSGHRGTTGAGCGASSVPEMAATLSL